MTVTSEDVRMKLFSRQLRGYAMEEVDAFLDGVAVELERLGAIISDLESRLGHGGTEQPPMP